MAQCFTTLAEGGVYTDRNLISYMAMEATHIRFALDLMPMLRIADIDAYCAGAVYPDTRYVTRVDRHVTHGPACPHDPFADDLTDFERGWATHLLYDHLAGDVMKSYLSPDLGELRQGSPAWAMLGAMKIVEDLESIRLKPELLQHLQRLSIRQSPAGESSEQLDEFCDIASSLYRSVPAVVDYCKWIVKLGVSESLAHTIQTHVRAIQNDADFSAKIRAIYGETLEGVLIARRGKSA